MDWTYFWQVNLNAPATLPNPSYYTHLWQEERKKTTNLVQKNVKWPLFCQRFVAIYCHQRDSFWSDQPKFMRYIHIHTFRNIIIVSLWSACLLLEVTHGGKVTHTNWTKKKEKKNWSMQFQRLHQLKAQYEFIIMTVDTKSRFLGEIAWSLEGRLTRVVWYHWIVEVNPINQSAPNEIAIVFVCPCTLRRPRAWVAWNSWSSWKWGHIRRWNSEKEEEVELWRWREEWTATEHLECKACPPSCALALVRFPPHDVGSPLSSVPPLGLARCSSPGAMGLAICRETGIATVPPATAGCRKPGMQPQCHCHPASWAQPFLAFGNLLRN